MTKHKKTLVLTKTNRRKRKYEEATITFIYISYLSLCISHFLDENHTPISNAASTGDLKLVKFLVENGADIKGSSLFPNLPIYLAISRNHLETVSYFLNKGVDPNFAWPNENGGTLLISAIQFGYLPIAKLLVSRGADVNFTGNGKYSPLYRTIIYDRFVIFEFLMNYGAELNKCDNEALVKLNWRSIERNQKYAQKLPID
jgi:ankyrin repeat protein